MDRLGQDIDGNPGPDGKDALMDGRRGIGTGHRGADELAGRSIHDDRHVAEGRLDTVPARTPSEVGDQLEGVQAAVPGFVERQADRGRFGLCIRRARQGPVVRHDRLAEGHPDREFALVVALVGVEFGAGRVAHDPEAVRDAQSPIAGERRAAGRIDPVVLEADVVDRERASDGQEDGVPLDEPMPSDTINVAPGERFTVLYNFAQPGVWAWHCHILNHAEGTQGMFGMVTAVIVEE